MRPNDLKGDIQSYIESGCAVGKPPDRDQIDAGRGNRGNRFRTYAAAGFGDHANRQRFRTASLSCADVMLSSSTASIGSRKRLAQLIERIDLDFDLHHVPDARAHARDRFVNRAGEREVIVFDQHGVVEAEAMIAAAAAAHGVFL